MALLLYLLFFASALIFLLNGVRAKKSNLTPSPPKLPIIGNLHQLSALPHRSLRALSNKHGPLMLLHLGQIPTLIVSSAEMAEQIMKTHDLVLANRPSQVATRQLFYGCTDIAFAPYGEYWRQVRKICVLELLSAKRVNSFHLVREEEVALMVETISQSCSTGAAVNLAKLLVSLPSGIISRVAFGKKYGDGEDGKNTFADLLKEVERQLVAFSVGDFFPSLSWVDVLTGLDARLKRTSHSLDAFLDQVINDHLIRTTTDGWDGVEQRDLVDVLLQMQKDSTLDIHLTRNNLKAIIWDMIAAGSDTTALTIEWVMAELIKHPNVMEKAQAEVRRVVGNETKVKEDDLHQLDYLKCIIKETLRLHPIAPLLLPRESTSNVMLQDYHIPAKTRVFINAWAIGRDPKLWESADEFVPERFFKQPIDFKGHDFQFIPFGAGRRICPGISFATVLVELALANLLYWFDWVLPDGLIKDDLDMSEAFGMTIYKKLPLHLVPKHHFS